MSLEDVKKRQLEWHRLQAEIVSADEYKRWTCPNCCTTLKMTFTRYFSGKVGFILHCPNCKETLSTDGKIAIPVWWSEHLS